MPLGPRPATSVLPAVPAALGEAPADGFHGILDRPALRPASASRMGPADRSR